MRPHPASGTSPLASYKEVPATPPPPDVKVGVLTCTYYISELTVIT